MFNKLLSWKFVGIGYLILGSVAGFYYLKYDAAVETISARDEKVISLKAGVNGLNDDIVKMQQDIEAEVRKQQQLRETNRQLDRKYRSAVGELERAKGRQDIVWQKPTLVERMLRRNWKQYTDESSCVMGVLEKCEEK
jgi:peptidoglycan hydrolase CwlO-like protein